MPARSEGRLEEKPHKSKHDPEALDERWRSRFPLLLVVTVGYVQLGIQKRPGPTRGELRIIETWRARLVAASL